MRVLVTGSAGFIGHHLCRRLLAPSDVARTHADTALLRALVGAVPQMPIGGGIPAFVA